MERLAFGKQQKIVQTASLNYFYVDRVQSQLVRKSDFRMKEPAFAEQQCLGLTRSLTYFCSGSL